MNIKKTAVLSAGSLMIVSNIAPVYAQSVSSVNNAKLMQVCRDEITDSADMIAQFVDGIEIKKEEPAQEAPVYDEVTYTYEVLESSPTQTMTVEEFMSLYGQMMEEESETGTEVLPVDTSEEEEVYRQALENYNLALAQYEAASRMIETTKEVEVEVTEEVTDDEGNVTMSTRTELQTVTELVPAGDVDSAKANLEAASAALEMSKSSLETANAQSTTVIHEEVVTEEIITNADSGVCGENVVWSLDDDGNLTISGTGDMEDYDSYEPNLPWGSEIKSVTISSGVTRIGQSAFYECSSLETVTIPDTVTAIGESAFLGCSSLLNIELPASINTISNRAFNGCSGLTSITIPEGVEIIGEYAFGACTNLTNFVIPNTLTQIRKYAFIGCESLENITIPENIVYVGDSAFQECSNLNKVIILSSSIHFGIDSFKECDQLISAGPIGSESNIEFVWEDEIPDYAFTSCYSLTKVTIPETVTRIGARAFEWCNSLEEIDIPESITEIDSGAFYRCESLASVRIPDGVKKIDESTFANCTNLISVTIPDSVTSVGSWAFLNCTALESIIIPDSVTSIGMSAFYNCSGLSEVTLPNEIEIIENSVFQGCSSLTKVVIPDSVTAIEGAAFKDCTSLAEVTLPETIEEIGAVAFENTPYLNNIPGDFVELIPGHLYMYRGSSTEVIIPDSVTHIGESVFRNKTDITKVTIPNSVTNIGWYAFRGCSGLTEITVPSSVETIEYYAFEGCTNLKTVTLYKGIQKIGQSVFNGCSQFTDIYYHGTEEDWNEIELSTGSWGRSIPESVVIHYIDDSFPFTDVPQDAWYYSVAKECYETGLINGTSATTFSPMQTMTRAMVVTILWRMDGQPAVTFNDKFSDVSSKQWYATSISWAEQAGVVHGYGDGTFKPDAAVTREQVAVMLANYAQYKGVYVPGTKKLNEYPDGSQVSNWAQAGMKWAITNGIISGNGAGYLNPKKSATRAEGAAMLLRMKNWL